MRAATISSGLVATLLIAGCAAKPAQNSGNNAAVATPAVPAAQPAASEQPVATQAALVDTPANAPASAADDEVSCRNEKLLGTRISKRVCKSREQLRLEEAAAREMMKNRDRKSHGVTDPITGGG